MVHVCAACGVLRPAEDLIAFWALADPGRRRYVCRPTRPSPESRMPCFTMAVGTADRFGIALVAPEPAREPHVRPRTPEWEALMAEAWVKSA